MERSFDDILTEKWRKAEENGVLRYTLNIQHSKILNGKYRFLAQLNTDRGEKRRMPENILSMVQPFDQKRFNFTKLADKEILMHINEGTDEDVIAINVSPIECNHSLLITQRFQQLPQIMTLYSLQKAVDLFFRSQSPYLRVAFNSLGAHASVNHLHWHIYYLKQNMLLERINLHDYVGPVQVLKDYPGKGFCIKYSTVENIDNLVTWAFIIVDYLQKKHIAHNVYITRAQRNHEDTKCSDLRIYIWPRKFYGGMKYTSDFVPAVCELFGHLSIKSEELYNNLTETYVEGVLKDITEEIFLSVTDELEMLIKEKMVKCFEHKKV